MASAFGQGDLGIPAAWKRIRIQVRSAITHVGEKHVLLEVALVWIKEQRVQQVAFHFVIGSVDAGNSFGIQPIQSIWLDRLRNSNRSISE